MAGRGQRLGIIDGRLAGDAVRAALIGIVAAAVGFLLFTALNYLSLGRDLPAARAHIAEAFADGALGTENWPRGDTQIGMHQFNDCLILAMAIDQRGTAAELTVSPIWTSMTPSDPVCGDLKRLIAGAQPDPDRAFYHRYIHGHTMLARYLLPVMAVDQMRMLYKTILGGAILLGAGLCLWALAQERHPREALFWLIVFFAFGRFFGIEVFDQSLGHAPSDLMVILFALGLAAASIRGGLPDRWIAPAAALFGAATMIVEFLTGGIPLGLAMVIGGMPIAFRREPHGPSMASKLVRAVVAYGAAIAACIVFKLLLIIAVFGTEGLAGISAQLAARMGVGAPIPGLEQTPYRFVVQIFKGLDSLVPGSREFSAAVLGLAVSAGVWGLRLLRRSDDPAVRVQGRLLAASNLVLPLWLVAFWAHSIGHSWFMDRIFVWVIASGFGLFALALGERRAVEMRNRPAAP